MMKQKHAPRSRKVVLTGGPCAGKTTISEVLGRAFPDKVLVLPESASLLFRGGFPRWNDQSTEFALQRAVYRVQLELESAYTAHAAGALFVLDRGTIDGAAYWPKGPEDFFKAFGTTENAELQRYDKVIFLESAGEQDYEANRKKNPVRLEDWSRAKALDETTRAIWSRHPHLAVVKNQSSFTDKVFAVIRLIERELEQAHVTRNV